MRLIRQALGIVLACSALAVFGHTSAHADDADIRSGDDGYIQGDYGYDDRDRGGGATSEPGSRTPPGSSSITEEADEDITMHMCDGELAVHSPYDCPGYLPPPDLDRGTAQQLSRQLVVRLQLPKPTPQFGPDPADNEWSMMAVGYPVWLWTEGPTTVTATESAYGYTFTLRAHYRSTTFDMGDGKTKQCTDTTVYRKTVKPGTASPNCGYTYLKAARDGTYTVTATTHWDVDWSVAGFSGTLPGTHSASRQLAVGELQAIVVK